MASLEATAMAKLVLNAIVGNLMGAHLFPSGITTIMMSPVGPVSVSRRLHHSALGAADHRRRGVHRIRMGM